MIFHKYIVYKNYVHKLVFCLYIEYSLNNLNNTKKSKIILLLNQSLNILISRLNLKLEINSIEHKSIQSCCKPTY